MNWVLLFIHYIFPVVLCTFFLIPVKTDAQPPAFYNYYLDGNGYLVQKMWDKAIENYNKALTVYTVDYVYFNRGNAKFGLKDYKGAIADYDKTISLNNEYSTAYYQRALVRFAMGENLAGCEDMKMAKKYNCPGANDEFKKNCKQ
ncbi:MAG: tetratricopeptide repeat protein [Bacteroidetes bacterium]|nr:tetratricopeptide repeat protein [Bacteroidota bacterium]